MRDFMSDRVASEAVVKGHWEIDTECWFNLQKIKK